MGSKISEKALDRLWSIRTYILGFGMAQSYAFLFAMANENFSGIIKRLPIYQLWWSIVFIVFTAILWAILSYCFKMENSILSKMTLKISHSDDLSLELKSTASKIYLGQRVGLIYAFVISEIALFLPSIYSLLKLTEQC